MGFFIAAWTIWLDSLIDFYDKELGGSLGRFHITANKNSH